MRIRFSFFLLPVLFSGTIAAQQHQVVVYGGTPSGIVAAVAASRNGAAVTIIEPTKHVGGLNTSGIGTAETEHMIEETISGLPLEFYTGMGKYYGLNKPAFYFESHVAEKVFMEMLAAAKVTLIFEAYADKVVKKDGVIQSVVLCNGKIISGDVFIDATYEGDLMARAGVPYTFGRESIEEYGESLAGVRMLDKPVEVSPYQDGLLLPGFVEAGSLVNGAASKRVINYNFRLMMSTNADKTPFPAPVHYDAGRYKILRRLLEKKPETVLTDIIDRYSWNYPKGKYETNNKQNALISLGLFGGNTDYPDADYKTRALIYQDHKDWTLGLLYFLLHDPSVPPTLQKETAGYGLAPDEFTDNGNFPYYLYVREARRMVGAYVQTQKDIFTDTVKEDAIALGSHFVDCHHVQRVAVSPTQFMNEGRIWEKVEQPYEIAYRILTPKMADCKNLLVPVAVSASHVAFCSLRVEITWMQMGQAAGTAAALAAREKCPVQSINIPELQKKLNTAGVVFKRNHQTWHTNDRK